VIDTTGSEPVVVDSSGWLEYITSDTKGNLFEPYLRAESLVVPTIVLYEVRKILLLRQPKSIADWFVSQALRHPLIPVDQEIALNAAVLSLQHKLAMADALVYASASKIKADLITSDSDFGKLPGVTLL
jgi:toxin FitB